MQEPPDDPHAGTSARPAPCHPRLAAAGLGRAAAAQPLGSFSSSNLVWLGPPGQTPHNLHRPGLCAHGPPPQQGGGFVLWGDIQFVINFQPGSGRASVRQGWARRCRAMGLVAPTECEPPTAAAALLSARHLARWGRTSCNCPPSSRQRAVVHFVHAGSTLNADFVAPCRAPVPASGGPTHMDHMALALAHDQLDTWTPVWPVHSGPDRGRKPGAGRPFGLVRSCVKAMPTQPAHGAQRLQKASGHARRSRRATGRFRAAACTILSRWAAQDIFATADSCRLGREVAAHQALTITTTCWPAWTWTGPWFAAPGAEHHWPMCRPAAALLHANTEPLVRPLRN